MSVFPLSVREGEVAPIDRLIDHELPAPLLRWPGDDPTPLGNYVSLELEVSWTFLRGRGSK